MDLLAGIPRSRSPTLCQEHDGMVSAFATGRLRIAALACWILAIAQLATAQVPDFGNFESKLGGGLGGFGGRDKKVTVTSEFTEAVGDAPAMLFVTAKIVPGLHLYAIDQGKTADGDGPSTTVIKLDAGQDVKLLAPFQHIQSPKSHVDSEVWKGLELREHYDEVTWYAPVEFAASTDPAVPRTVMLSGVKPTRSAALATGWDSLV